MQILSDLGLFSSKSLDLFLTAYPSSQLTLTRPDLITLAEGSQLGPGLP